MARSIRKQLGVLFPSKRRRVKQSEEHYTESRRRRLEGGRTVVWFSCGATSAVAAKLAIMRYDGTRDVRICYCDTGSEHPDNARFLRDCEEWFGREVEILRSAEYRDIWDVYRRTRYLVGVRGARCTVELKKKMRQQYEQIASDIQVFGFDAEEEDRVARFRQNNPEMYLETPLIDRGLDKADCLAIIEKSGIEIPMMYRHRDTDDVPIEIQPFQLRPLRQGTAGLLEQDPEGVSRGVRAHVGDGAGARRGDQQDVPRRRAHQGLPEGSARERRELRRRA